jgi:hypothetical protein
MAWLEQHPTSSRFKLCFRWDGKQFKKTIKTTERRVADAALVRLEENIRLAGQGRLEIPDVADVAAFLVSDGRLGRPAPSEPPPEPLTLGDLPRLDVAVLRPVLHLGLPAAAESQQGDDGPGEHRPESRDCSFVSPSKVTRDLRGASAVRLTGAVDDPGDDVLHEVVSGDG